MKRPTRSLNVPNVETERLRSFLIDHIDSIGWECLEWGGVPEKLSPDPNFTFARNKVAFAGQGYSRVRHHFLWWEDGDLAIKVIDGMARSVVGKGFGIPPAESFVDGKTFEWTRIAELLDLIAVQWLEPGTRTLMHQGGEICVRKWHNITHDLPKLVLEAVCPQCCNVKLKGEFGPQICHQCIAAENVEPLAPICEGCGGQTDPCSDPNDRCYSTFPGCERLLDIHVAISGDALESERNEPGRTCITTRIDSIRAWRPIANAAIKLFTNTIAPQNYDSPRSIWKAIEDWFDERKVRPNQYLNMSPCELRQLLTEKLEASNPSPKSPLAARDSDNAVRQSHLGARTRIRSTAAQKPKANSNSKEVVLRSQLVIHHEFDPSTKNVGNWTPMGCTELAQRSNVSKGTASNFFNYWFSGVGLTGHAAYRKLCACEDGKLLVALCQMDEIPLSKALGLHCDSSFNSDE